MGRNNKKRRDHTSKGKGGGRKPKEDVYRSDLIERADMDNERFSAYYRAQEILEHEEWEPFMEALRQSLPTTFRLAGSRQIAQSLNKIIEENHVPSLTDVTFEGQQLPPPVQIAWYPEGLAWQFNVSKKALRKSPEFKKFHSFLVFETEVGNISRQEAVSMLPPLFLNVEPHHMVMDMCAAPGSKTAQLLEALHANDSLTSSSTPSGLLLANDSDHKRTHLLIHQSARLPSPALLVTNLDASIYPVIKVPVDFNGVTGKRKGQLLFDRILCDVPCSGDGTLRKNVAIWKSWQVMDGNGLHSLQVRILQRAMKLLKDDGRIVYSTCSLNPVENEAVVAEALRSTVGQPYRLVDVSDALPQLKRRPGLTTWRPTADRSAETTFESYQAFMAGTTDETLKSKMSEGHWPPQDAEKLNLSRCVRIYPHLQDTGGFFIAVLERKSVSEGRHRQDRKRKTEDLEEIQDVKKPRLVDPASEDVAAEDEAMLDVTTPTDEIGEAPPLPLSAVEESSSAERSKGSDSGVFKENPYTFLPSDDPTLASCIERLSLNTLFPRNNVLVRNPTGDAARSLYLANDAVKAVIENNDYNRIRLTSAGTKVFAKQEAGRGSDAQFRVLGEGLPVVLPYIDPACIMTGNLAALKVLLESHYPLCTTFSEPFRGLIQSRVTGSHVVRFPPETWEGVALAHELIVPIWKSTSSATLMIDKKAKNALSLRLFGTMIAQPTAGVHPAKEKQAGTLQEEEQEQAEVGVEDLEEEL